MFYVVFDTSGCTYSRFINAYLHQFPEFMLMVSAFCSVRQMQRSDAQLCYTRCSIITGPLAFCGKLSQYTVYIHKNFQARAGDIVV